MTAHPAPAPAIVFEKTASRPAPRGLVVLAGFGTFVLLTDLVRLFVFMFAASPEAGWSATPWNPFITNHSCTTAYWAAGTEVDAAPDVYHPRTYTVPGTDAAGRPLRRKLGPFIVDPYEYPPTFLLLPRLLALATPAFEPFRRLWFVVNLAIVALALVAVGRRLDRDTGSRTLWLAPLAILPIGVVGTLQGGNAQLAFVALSMLAMLAFERKWPAAGGLLLAYATVGKLFPGILVLYLLLRRDWRAVVWTTAWSAVLTAITLLDLGWAPFAAFLDHVPRLLSGEAFPALRDDGPAAMSLSVPGIVLKLRAFGVPGMSFGALRIAGWIYSLLLLWATVRIALRPVAARWEPLAWLAILALATLRSPFLPGYGAFQAVWIATILAAACWREPRLRFAALGLWVLLLPTTAGPTVVPPTAVAVLTFVQTLAILVLVAMAIRIGRADGPAEPPARV